MATTSTGATSQPVEAIDLEKRIVQFCQTSPVTGEDLMAELANVDPEQRLSALNRLLSRGQIEVLKFKNSLVYKVRDTAAAKNMQGADNEEKSIYQIIEAAGNLGIWNRDIRKQCNLPMTQVTKTIKILESKKLIKPVKSVAASKKKVYMLYNLHPHQTVSGGAWYTDGVFDSQLVETLNQQCNRFLQGKALYANERTRNPMERYGLSSASTVEIRKHINDSGIYSVQLSVSEIEAVLDTLVYDGKIEKRGAARSATSEDDTGYMYRAIKPVLQSTGFVRIPCGVCPLIEFCEIGTDISPTTCQYMADWLTW